jgi:hypothetical protein
VLRAAHDVAKRTNALPIDDADMVCFAPRRLWSFIVIAILLTTLSSRFFALGLKYYEALNLALRHCHQHVLGINLFEINENEQNVSANQKDTK